MTEEMFSPRYYAGNPSSSLHIFPFTAIMRSQLFISIRRNSFSFYPLVRSKHYGFENKSKTFITAVVKTQMFCKIKITKLLVLNRILFIKQIQFHQQTKPSMMLRIKKPNFLSDSRDKVN